MHIVIYEILIALLLWAAAFMILGSALMLITGWNNRPSIKYVALISAGAPIGSLLEPILNWLFG